MSTIKIQNRDIHTPAAPTPPLPQKAYVPAYKYARVLAISAILCQDTFSFIRKIQIIHYNQ